MRGDRIAGRTTWTTAGAASLAAHAVLLALVVWLLGRHAPVVEAPGLDVQLVTLEPRPRIRPPPRPASVDETASPTPATPSPRRAAAPSPDVAPLPLPPASAADDPSAGVARALRGRLGCRPGDHARQSQEERDRCAMTLAEAGAARDRRLPALDLSRQGRITKDPDFDLSRRPKNGCGIRAAGDKGALGDQGAAVGFTCAWDF